MRYQTHAIKPEASALEAMDKMDQLGIDSLYVMEESRGLTRSVSLPMTICAIASMFKHHPVSFKYSQSQNRG